MLKKWLFSTVLVGILGCTLAACGNGNEKTSSTDGTAKQVKILTSVTGGKDDPGMAAFQKKLSELTGYKVKMEKPAGDYNKVLMQKLKAGGEGLDLIYFDQSMLQDLVDQGALMDLSDRIEKSSILSDTSNIPKKEWDSIKVKGKIYASFNKKEVHRVVNVNQALLDKYGITLGEESLAGYHKLFQQLKTADKEAGFYPFNAVVSELYDFQPWFAEKGLKGGIVTDSSGKKTVPWASSDAVPVWKWLHQLYAEGLMDPNSLTDTTKELRNKFQSSQTAVAVDWAAWTGLYNMNAGSDYPSTFKTVPLGGAKTPDGSYMLTRGGASLWGIPASSKNPKGAMKILETFATQKGGDLLSVGVEGYDYTIKNGKFVQTEAGKKANNDHGAPFPISEKYKSPAPANAGVEEAMKLLPYASIEAFLPETTKYKEIVSAEAIKIIKGDKTAAEGVKEMNTALKQAGVISE